MRRLWVAVVLIAGCQLQQPPSSGDGGASDGGFDAGTGSLSGPLAFGVHQSFELHNVDSQGNLTGYSLVLVDYDNTCSQLESGNKPAAFHQVQAGVVAAAANDGPPAGTYQVMTSLPTTGFAAYVEWEQFYGDGGGVGPLLAQSGTVTFTAADANRLSGTFEADVPDPNGQVTHLSGTFDAPYCP